MSFEKVDEKKIEKAAELFKSFGNPIRIKIIDALKDKSLRVMDLSGNLGYPQPIISQQIKVLKNAGIVHKIKDGRNYLYKLSNPLFSEMIHCMRGCMKI